MIAASDDDSFTNLQMNYCYMENEGTLSTVEHVKFMIQYNGYSMHDYEPHLERLNETCVAVLSDYNKTLRYLSSSILLTWYNSWVTVLSDYNKALDEKNIVTQELYHVRRRLEDKKLKIIMLEKDMLLEKR